MSSTASPSPSPTPSSTPEPAPCRSITCGLPSLGTLYLLTALTAVAILLLISGIVCGRACYRRRLRQRGLLPPDANIWADARTFSLPNPIPGGGPRGRRAKPVAGPQPELYDVYVQVGKEYRKADLETEKSASTRLGWDAILPLSASVARPCPPSTAPPPPQAPLPEPVVIPGAGAGTGLAMAIFSRSRRRAEAAAATPASLPPPADSLPLSDAAHDPTPDPDTLTIACMVQMPQKSACAGEDEKSDDGEEDQDSNDALAPLVELGVLSLSLPVAAPHPLREE
ncbi:hypothetical protein MKEN_01306100 [Mycena kentingensis (nom. inval.)]|nr:hypothetical protein MKEN_01306100 [Mycena kentingensis (nom. inval.)]